MQILNSLILFAAQTSFIVMAILLVVFAIAILIARGRFKPELETQDLGESFTHFKEILEFEILDKKKFKQKQKEEKKEHKKKSKEAKESKRKIFVIDFEGDLKASAVESLRQEISAILQVATTEDEVLLRLESPGGMVTGYGLAASQLMRLKEKSVKLVVSVDKVAASGGYMMACVGHRILGAPFAIFGSIGVVASLPNFHSLLKKNDIRYEEVTAGEYKRTVSILGEITEKGMEKFKSQLEDTHLLFKSFVGLNRPTLNLSEVATGEHWYGTQALKLGLIDHIQTSDDYLMSHSKDAQVLKVKFNVKKNLSERLSGGISQVLALCFEKILYKTNQLY